MKNWIKYGLYNACVGIIIGGFIAFYSIGDGYHVFAITAPIAAFLTGGFFWRLIIKESRIISKGKVIATGLLTGIISHYLTFVLLGIGSNICFWMTGSCTTSLGYSPMNILDVLNGAFIFTFFSLLFFGWITAPASILLGFLITRKK